MIFLSRTRGRGVGLVSAREEGRGSAALRLAAPGVGAPRRSPPRRTAPFGWAAAEQEELPAVRAAPCAGAADSGADAACGVRRGGRGLLGLLAPAQPPSSGLRQPRRGRGSSEASREQRPGGSPEPAAAAPGPWRHLQVKKQQNLGLGLFLVERTQQFSRCPLEPPSLVPPYHVLPSETEDL